ncbi:hypothetical protein K491DRAFT_721960 [Lophiostoma macrostomum CBS 122681]|uniref:DUF6604 domain-containing protein n=1 Tax=Lophiostoma macrostomum CBS 122681 TaxID=1314788 RepID=A0A6A6SNM0_9PLEO|nr:hypothetical protein K491DRAFT_721960 [Lophiostoma macrostomum CBS 122681]
MTSESLRSIYQQYKHDTNVVASWLATTAKAAGYKTPVVGPASSTSSAKASARPKGKARKQAKANNAGQATTTAVADEPAKPKYVIAIKDFVPLAEHIATLKSAAVKVPGYFSVALERVIWARSSFSSKLAQAGKKVNGASDVRHSSFVSVLQKVRKTLSPLLDADAFNVASLRDAISDVSGVARKGPLNNLFEVLEVYEPSAAFVDAPDMTPPTPAETEYTVEAEEDSLFEALFAMTALMDDLTRLRGEISELWADYNSGKRDLAAVSIASHAAIDLARSYEEEIRPLFQKNGGTTKFHGEYFSAVCTAFGLNCEAKQKYGDDYNYACYDIADALLVNPMMLINAFVRANPLDPDEIPMYNGMFGWYDERTHSKPATPGRQKYNRDKAAFMELFPDLTFVCGMPNPIEDPLVRGMVTIRQDFKKSGSALPEVPVWYSFATQIYDDILNTVKIGKAWDELRRFMALVRETLALHAPNVCAERRKVIKDFDLWTPDKVAITRQAMGHPYKDHTFVRRNSLYCGLWVHHLRCMFHGQGVQDAAVPGAVLYTTQLYHALRQENMLSVQWKDLETLRKMQGSSTFSVGDPPTTIEGYFKNWCISMGVSATNWAPNKRSKNVKMNKDNMRNMKYKGWTSFDFARRIEAYGDRRLLSKDAIVQ